MVRKSWSCWGKTVYLQSKLPVFCNFTEFSNILLNTTRRFEDRQDARVTYSKTAVFNVPSSLGGFSASVAFHSCKRVPRKMSTSSDYEYCNDSSDDNGGFRENDDNGLL